MRNATNTEKNMKIGDLINLNDCGGFILDSNWDQIQVAWFKAGDSHARTVWVDEGRIIDVSQIAADDFFKYYDFDQRDLDKLACNHGKARDWNEA
tara:strand:+ start:4447 stop:4731 length:285 start_codon:yes stop_codon:yes gene_type:complete